MPNGRDPLAPTAVGTFRTWLPLGGAREIQTTAPLCQGNLVGGVGNAHGVARRRGVMHRGTAERERDGRHGDEDERASLFAERERAGALVRCRGHEYLPHLLFATAEKAIGMAFR